MDEKQDTLEGGAREGSSKPSVSDPLNKKLSRVDKLAAGMVSLAYAVQTLGRNLDEGPLRSATLEAATQGLSWARSVQSQGRGHRANRDDARAVAIQTRNGDADDRG